MKHQPKQLLVLYALIGGTLRLSTRGVPHIVTNTKKSNTAVSVCWMNRSRVYRIFSPYPAARQTRVDLPTAADVQKWLITQ